MNRIELAAEMNISVAALKSKMKRKLSSEFLREIRGSILLPNHVKYIYEELSGMNKRWSKVQK